VQFYLLYPFLLWTIRRVGWVPMGLVLLIAEILLVEQPKTLTSARVVNPWEYFFLARYFEWFLGAAAAEAYTRRGFVLSWKLGMIGSGLGAICSLTSTFLPVLWPYRELFVSMSTVCVMSMLLQQRAELPGHLLRWLAGVGVYSYSLYLLHYPMLRLVNVMNGLIAELFGVALDHRTFMILLIPTLPIVFAASYGFYWLFERPFLTLYRTEVPNRKTLPLVTKAEPTGTVRSTSVPCATPPAPVAMP
jgi:peptidoglycan/LPS O-acetylase OafA/YrhL